MFFEAGEGDEITLSFNNILKDGTITVTAKVYNKDDTQIGSNISLSHVADGLYTNKYTIPTGNDVLTIIYIPSGSDNATSIDQIKVRFLSPYGHGGGVAGGAEITDDDIKKIAQEIGKIDVWGQKLTSGRTAEQELLAKSEFDSEKEKVITEIEPTDLTSVNRNVDSKMSEMKQAINKLLPLIKTTNDLNTKVSKIDLTKVNSISQVVKDLSSDIRSIPKAINLMQNEVKDARNKLLDIKSPTETGMESLKKLILDADDFQRERFQAMTLSILTLLENIVKELKSNNGNFDKAIKEVESLKQVLNIFNLKNLQNEII